MIIIVKQDAKEERVRDLIQWIEAQNLRTHVSKGDYATIIGVIGDISKLDDDLITGLDIVEGVKHISEPFKSANRKALCCCNDKLYGCSGMGSRGDYRRSSR